MKILILCTGNSCRSQMAEGFLRLCDDAEESCPAFKGKVKHHLHIGFKDTAAITGTKEDILNIYRKVRKEIREKFYEFYTVKFGVS